MTMNSGTRKKGFTLVELLVVIAILAVLLTLITPALQKAREHARKLLCATNMSSWGKAIQMYAADHDGYFPNNGFDPIRNSFDFVWVSGTMQEYFFPQYLYKLDKRSTEDYNTVLFCPTERFHRSLYGNSFQYYVDNGLVGYSILFGNDWDLLRQRSGFIDYTPPTCPNGLEWILRKKLGGKYNKGPILVDNLYSLGSLWSSAGVPFSSHADPKNNDIPEGGNFLFEDGHVDWYSGVDNGVDTIGQIRIGGYQGGWTLYYGLPDVW